jgi:hypothetical protein
MVSHTAEEILENAWRKCEQTLYAGLVHAKKTEPDNSWGQAREQAKFLASLPLIEALPIIALLNAQRLTPSASCRATHPRDGEQGRSEIGGHLNTEVRPAGQL